MNTLQLALLAAVCVGISYVASTLCAWLWFRRLDRDIALYKRIQERQLSRIMLLEDHCEALEHALFGATRPYVEDSPRPAPMSDPSDPPDPPEPSDA